MKPPASYKGISEHRKRLGRAVVQPHEPPMDRVAKFTGMPHEHAHKHLMGAGYAHNQVFSADGGSHEHHHYHHMGKKHSVHLRVHPDTGEVDEAMGHDLGGSEYGGGGQY